MAEFIKSIPVQVQCRLCSKIADKYYNALTNASIRDCVRKFMNLEVCRTIRSWQMFGKFMFFRNICFID